MMQVSGKITHTLDIVSGQSANGTWQKRTIVVETGDKYPKSVALQLWGDLCDLSLNVGDIVTADVNLESREYNGKWYSDIKAWKIELAQAVSQPPQVRGNVVEDDSDLPFGWLIPMLLPILGMV